jgi:hypothetical protein
MKNTTILTVIIAAMISLSSCKKAEPASNDTQANATAAKTANQDITPPMDQFIGAYYNGELSRLMVRLLSPDEVKLLLSDPNKYEISRIYHTDDKIQYKSYLDVIDAKPEIGRVIYWQQINYSWLDFQKYAQQYLSSDQIIKAANGDSPALKLQVTEVFYQGYVEK